MNIAAAAVPAQVPGPSAWKPGKPPVEPGTGFGTFAVFAGISVLMSVIGSTANAQIARDANRKSVEEALKRQAEFIDQVARKAAAEESAKAARAVLEGRLAGLLEDHEARIGVLERRQKATEEALFWVIQESGLRERFAEMQKPAAPEAATEPAMAPEAVKP